MCVRESVNGVCPIDMKPSKYIVDNIALSEQIGELVIHCKYGCKKEPGGAAAAGEYVVDKEGCPATIKISDRYEHEKGCGYSPMSCPNNRDCQQFLRKVCIYWGLECADCWMFLKERPETFARS